MIDHQAAATSKSKAQTTSRNALAGTIGILIGVGGLAAWRSYNASLPAAQTAALIPTCDSPLARDALQNAIEENALKTIATLKLLDVRDATQLKANATQRLCSATLVLNSGEVPSRYIVSLTTRGEVLVSVGDDQDIVDASPAAQPASAEPTNADPDPPVLEPTYSIKTKALALDQIPQGRWIQISGAWFTKSSDGQSILAANLFESCGASTGCDPTRLVFSIFAPRELLPQVQAGTVKGSVKVDGVLAASEDGQARSGLNAWDDDVLMAAMGTAQWLATVPAGYRGASFSAEMEPLEPRLVGCQDITVQTDAGELRFACGDLAMLIWQGIRE